MSLGTELCHFEIVVAQSSGYLFGIFDEHYYIDILDYNIEYSSYYDNQYCDRLVTSMASNIGLLQYY